MSCGKFEEKIVEEISSMSSIQPYEVTRKFLLDSIVSFKDRSSRIEDFVYLLRIMVLQPITRSGGERLRAKNMLIKLLEYVGKHEAHCFAKYIDELEAEAKKQGRSYFEK